jgi:hypothetical protein
VAFSFLREDTFPSRAVTSPHGKESHVSKLSAHAPSLPNPQEIALKSTCRAVVGAVVMCLAAEATMSADAACVTPWNIPSSVADAKVLFLGELHGTVETPLFAAIMHAGSLIAASS